MTGRHRSVAPSAVFRALAALGASLIILSATLGGVQPAVAAAGPAKNRPGPPAPVVAGELIVKYKAGVDESERELVLGAAGVEGKHRAVFGSPDLELVSVPPGRDPASVMKRLEAQGAVESVQPNFVYRPCAAPPTDPLFPRQWGLDNATYPAIDVDALAAWDVTTGEPTVIVGVMDEGVDINHPDLVDNIWTDPGEAGPLANNGLDDDRDGFVDDVHGWDFLWNDNTVFDSGFGDRHGTYVAGIIAALTNNALGVAGVAPRVKIMPLKFIGPAGGTTVAAIQAINYARAHGAKVINASWGTGAYDQALRDAIQAFGETGGIFIAAAGNGDASGYGYDTDVTPFYPACYDLPNIISVAAVDSQGGLLLSSNFGKTTVDLAAPGAGIVSTIPSLKPAGGPAAVEVADSSGYRTVVWGFGAEGFTDPAARQDAIARAMTSLAVPPGGKVLLVDDDESGTGSVDVRPSYETPLTALGYTVTVWNVADGDTDGPGPADMALYDAVVWFTGKGVGGVSCYALTPNDQANLTAYLTSGPHGRLFLSGPDALWGSEETAFVRNVLRVWDLGEWDELVDPTYAAAYPHTGLVGTGGAYAGADYTGKWLGDGTENFLAPWGAGARSTLAYPGGPYDEAYYDPAPTDGTLDGTSAAAPFVAGVAALLVSHSPTATPADVVQAITTTVTPLAVLRETTVTGGLVNAPRALAAVATGVTVSPVALSLSEGGPAGSYTVALRGQPAADVTVTAVPGPEVRVDNGSGGASVTFTPADWFTPRTIMVAAIDDEVVEGGHTATINHTVTSTDPVYAGSATTPVTVNIADNDSGVVLVIASDGSTAVAEGAAPGEPGGADTYTVVLGRQPSADVTVIATPDSQLTVDNGKGGRTLVFTPVDWNVPQTFTVHAVDDTLVEGPHTGVVTHAAYGGGYDGVAIDSVTAAITDNDKPGLVIVESGGATAVTEGGATDTYTVALNGIPSGPVTVSASTTSPPPGQVTVSPASLTFDSSNWSTPREVTVTAVDDAVVESLHYDTIVYTATGGGYEGTEVARLLVTVTDNDSPGVSIVATSPTTGLPDGATTLTEGAAPGTAGAIDAYTVVLTRQPSGPVTVTAAPDAQFTVNNGSGGNTLVFTEANWNTPQTFTVSAVDDTVVEGPHSGTVAHSAAGGGYDGVVIASLTASITDNDPALVTITPTSGSTAVAEGAAGGTPGETDTYSVVLGGQPSAPVTITAVTDSQVTVTSSAGTSRLVFTPANWNVPQSFTVRAIDDAVVEGPHSSAITHTASGGGYTGAVVPPVQVAVTDNDSPGVTIAQSGGSTLVTEGGAVDTYTVVLVRQPYANVSVTATAQVISGATPSSQAEVAAGDFSAGGGVFGPSATLTFTPANWNTPQTVTVRAYDDSVIEGPHTTSISHTATGGAYDGVVISTVTVGVTDNDTPGVSVTPSGGSTVVAEGGAQDTYTVVLTHAPTADVTVTATTAGNKVTVSGGTGSGSSTSLVFTTADWNLPRTITVTAVDDDTVEGTHTATIAHAASGGGYDGVAIASLPVTIQDNDVPGVVITPTDPATGLSDGVTAVTEGAAAGSPGSSDTYTVVLTRQPTANVTITITPGSQLTATGPAGGGVLAFTPTDWNQAQTVTVRALDDQVVEGTHTATVTHTATGGGYFGVAIPNVQVVITDNDFGSVTLTETDPVTHAADSRTAVTEGAAVGTPGAADTYTVVLGKQPCADVTVTVTASPALLVAAGDYVSGGGVFGASAVLTFGADPASPHPWNVPQTVTVAAVDDEVIEGTHTGTLAHNATGGAYDGATFTVAGTAASAITATVTDDDIPGVTIVETDPTTGLADGSTAVTEGAALGTAGALDTYTVVLNHVPNGDVTVTATAGPQVLVAAGDWSGGGGSFGATAVLTFSADGTSPNAWNVPQTISVIAVDDEAVEGPHSETITHVAAGGGYDGATFYDATGAATSTVSAAVTDNDVPGVTIVETDPATGVPDGSTAVTEGAAGTGGAGAFDTYTVVLWAKPSGTVTVTAVPDEQVTVTGTGTGPGGAATLTFDQTNYKVPQTFTVEAREDAVVEGTPHPGFITHTASGGGYDGVTFYDAAGAPTSLISASVTDNDVPSVIVTETDPATGLADASTRVTEGAAAGTPGLLDTYTVVLGRQPCGTVTVTAAASPAGRVTVASSASGPAGSVALTFTTADWNVPQTVTVRAVDDAVVEGPHTASIVHSAAGGAYDGVVIDAVMVSLTDNDTGGVTLVQRNPTTGLPDSVTAITEGAAPGTAGATDVYTLALTAEPCGDVTVTATADGKILVETASSGGTPGPSATLVFTPADWNLPQPVTVTAVDDPTVEGTHTGVVAHAATGGAYDGVTIATLAVTVTDNDAAGVAVTPTDPATGVPDGSTAVTEGAVAGVGGTPGAVDTYTVVLTSQPTSDVTVTATAGPEVCVAAGDWSAGGGTFGPTAVLTFSPDGSSPNGWSTPRTISVAAVDDTLVEGAHTGTITHSVAGDGFTGVAAASVSVVVTDNDPGVILTETGGSTSVREGGTGDAYTVVLSAAPASDVTVTVDPDDQLVVDCGAGAGAAGEAGTLTFTPSDWATPRTVRVAAADDTADEGTHTGAVTHAVASADPAYAGLPAPVLSVTIADNDLPAPSAPPPGPAETLGGQLFDPTADATIRFANLGLTVFVPAGTVKPDPGEKFCLAAAVDLAAPGPSLEGEFGSVGPFFTLTLTGYVSGTGTVVTELAAPLTAVVDLTGKGLSGVDPQKVGLYVLDPEDETWAYLPSGYDPTTGQLVATLGHLSRFGVLVSSRTFGDIQTHWARRDVEVLVGRRVIQGVSPWQFAPGWQVTRAQFCALLVRALGLESDGSGLTPFTDVAPTAWYAAEVRTAYRAGLVQGITSTTFGPERGITRQELAVLLARALALRGVSAPLSQADVTSVLSAFTDAPVVASWARAAVAQVVTQGIVRGRTATVIAPTWTATRAEAAVMLKRFMDRIMGLPSPVTGVLQVSLTEGRHYELIVGGQVYTLVVDDRNVELLAALQGSVGGKVTLVGLPLPGAVTIYQRGVPLEVRAVVP